MVDADAIPHMEQGAKTQQALDHVERLLDSALEDTFPASDPVAVDVPQRTPAPVASAADMNVFAAAVEIVR